MRIVSLNWIISQLDDDEAIDLLKIDCEGCEYSVLLSASSDTLNRVSVICLEYHDRLTNHSHLELEDHLERNGFRVSTYPSPVHRGQGLLTAIRAGQLPAPAAAGTQ